MGQHADELIDGSCCSFCGTEFEQEHGFPVLCRHCYDTKTKAERAGLPRATEKEL